MEAMTYLMLAFDTLLGFTLLWLAWKALSSPDLFRSIVLFIAFGLLMALVWVRLDALDVALAEAAIGAGLTGALLLAALARLEIKNKKKITPEKYIKVQVMTENDNIQKLFSLFLITSLFILVAGLVYAVVSLPEQSMGLGGWVEDNLENSGVSNPVTAVLINFRAYDTLLEMSVLFLALLGVWSLGGVPKRQDSVPEPVLDILLRIIVPLFILVTGYLLWVGAHAAGGAFQGGSVLGAAGVLLFLGGWRISTRFSGLSLRILLILGLGIFIITGAAFMLFGKHFLEYPPTFAGEIILLIEAAATLSIGITLAALFLGGRALFRRHK